MKEPYGLLDTGIAKALTMFALILGTFVFRIVTNDILSVETANYIVNTVLIAVIIFLLYRQLNKHFKP